MPKQFPGGVKRELDCDSREEQTHDPDRDVHRYGTKPSRAAGGKP